MSRTWCGGVTREHRLPIPSACGLLTGIDLEVRDNPMMKLDELKLMSQPAGRDVTEAYLVA